MAKIQTETVILTFNRIVKNSDSANTGSMINEEIAQALEQVAQELAGAGVVVEVELAK